MAVRFAVAALRIVAIRHPRRRLSGVGRPQLAANVLHVLLAAVRLEVHADERRRTNPPAQVYEFAGSNLVRLDPTPEQVQHRRAPVPRPNALTPAVEVRKDSA